MPRAPITKDNPYYSRKYRRRFTTERGYREFLARRKGFSSWREEQRSPRPVRSETELVALRPSEQAARDRALEALSLMRREGLSRAEAARRAGTTASAILRHAGPALERTPTGRYRARPGDRLLRRLQVLSPEGKRVIVTRGSRAASLTGSHWNAIDHYLRTGDASRLRRYRGKTVGGIPLETDPDAIDEWTRRGELEIEDIYALTP